jgi:hypothetical protein
MQWKIVFLRGMRPFIRLWYRILSLDRHNRKREPIQPTFADDFLKVNAAPLTLKVEEKKRKVRRLLQTTRG